MAAFSTFARPADARNALDRADELSRDGADLDAIRHHAQVALLNAQIATQKMLTHEAQTPAGARTSSQQQRAGLR